MVLELYEGDIDRANAVIETFHEAWRLDQIKTGLKSDLSLIKEVNQNNEVVLSPDICKTLMFYVSEGRKCRLEQYKVQSREIERILDKEDISQAHVQARIEFHNEQMQNRMAQCEELVAFGQLLVANLVDSGVPAEEIAALNHQ